MASSIDFYVYNMIVEFLGFPWTLKDFELKTWVLVVFC